MRVAAIYDIHGNLPALEAVLEEIRQEKFDLVVVGGDVVPGPMPCETFDCLLQLEVPVQFILGNGDREVLVQMDGLETEWFLSAPEQWRAPVRWSAQQLRPEHREALVSWPLTCQRHIRELGTVLFCHATPRSDTEIFTRLTSEERLLPVFAGLRVPLIVCGHTHMQFERTVGTTRVVNAGSVGMPFQAPGAYWLALGPDIQLRRTAYDLAQAAERIRGTEYPQAHDFAARNVLQPPSEEETIAAFARVELQ